MNTFADIIPGTHMGAGIFFAFFAEYFKKTLDKCSLCGIIKPSKEQKTEGKKMDMIDMNRNRIVTVWKRPVIGTRENPELSFTDEFGVYWPHIDTIWGDFEKVKMTYEELCYDLGFDPDVNFVDVTRAGSITYTLGKPHEISALFRAVHEKGYKQKSNGRKQG